MAGRVAYAEMFDLSRLLLDDETIWSLNRLVGASEIIVPLYIKLYICIGYTYSIYVL